MQEEIKEILDRAKHLKYKCDCCEEIALGKYIMKDDKQTDNLIEAVYIIDRLLDYITNLQEENDYYFKKNNELSILNTSLRSNRDDYKSRCEKAIELIKDEGIYEEDTNTFCGEIYLRLPELLDILQGVDKE